MSNFFKKSKSFSPLKDGVQQVKMDHTVFNFQNEKISTNSMEITCFLTDRWYLTSAKYTDSRESTETRVINEVQGRVKW